MVKYYEMKKCDKTPLYALFQVNDFDCVTTLYESGKVVFQGLGADIEASLWIEKERIMNNRNINAELKGKDKKKESTNEKKVFINVSSVGSDEVGTGDFFGPLVVTAAYVPKDQFLFLQDLGVRDSKKLTDDKIISIGPDLIKNIVHTSIVLSNKEYNDYYNANMNMNKMKAVLHNKCLASVIEKDNVKYDKIVVDQFENPRSYYMHLNDVPKKVTGITFMTKAEDQCLAVAAASIISRYLFLKEMKKLNEKYNIIIPLGAGSMVDEVGATLVSKYGDKVLYEIGKYNFKNVDKIKEIAKARK
jgi:ribonuclease HIII